MAGTITSSPLFKFKTLMERYNASVPFPTPTQNLELQKLEKFFSNSFTSLVNINLFFFIVLDIFLIILLWIILSWL